MQKSPTVKKYPDLLYYYIAYDGELCPYSNPRQVILFRDKLQTNGNELIINGDNYKKPLVIDTNFYNVGYQPLVSQHRDGDMGLVISSPNTPFQGVLELLNPLTSNSQKTIGQTLSFKNGLDNKIYSVNLRDFFSIFVPLMKNGLVSGTFLYDFWNGRVIIRRVGDF